MNKRRIDADDIIFDLDGTLFSPLELSRQAWILACTTLGITTEAITTENLSRCFGQLPVFIMDVLIPGYSPALQKEVCDFAYTNENLLILQNLGELYPSVSETLARLKQHHRLCIVSNCQSGYIEAFLKNYSFENYFVGTCCSGDTGLPKEMNILSMCRDYELVRPVYIGDTQKDAMAAQAVGIPFVHATYGFGTVPDAMYTIDRLSDIEKLLMIS